ncbi:MAG TPA: class I SAM-dependent methyltransferase [Chitinophagales bacterium]|nr:class I SAM-dependent methyltransferase [Chitinophagales bacterium]HRK27906.1 class I SAM-dependent methyltransferase [Chitinophagales bacterium]
MPNSTSKQPSIKLEWLDFATYQPQIEQIRKEVFITEQQFGNHMLTSPKDQTGLHLAAWADGKIISCISSFVYDAAELAHWGMPQTGGKVVQFGRRVELPEYRRLRLATFLAACTYRNIFECINPDYYFVSLIGVHRQLRSFYERMYGFKYFGERETPNGTIDLLIMNNPEHCKQLYTRLRQMEMVFSQIFETPSPSLHEFALKTPAMSELINSGATNPGNYYLDALSFKDELPRLAKQARLLHLTQQPIYPQLDLHFSSGSFVDVGCGPGIYLSLLNKTAPFNQFKLIGVDISSDMVLYASLVHPKLGWQQASVYKLPFEDESVEIVHASFLFIHLVQPHLALLEIARILKPQGRLIITDANDSTFKGHRIITKMIEKHAQYHEGNRSILQKLPALATAYNLHLHQQFETIVDNQGNENAPTLHNHHLSLGRITMWGLFAFMGQRPEMTKYFQRAENLYLHSTEKIQISIQTQVYVKQ